jgi:uncharacterized protein (DUF1778 family)
MRRKPETISTRVTVEEKALIETAATAEGVPVSEFLHSVVVPAACERVSQLLGNQQGRTDEAEEAE